MARADYFINGRKRTAPLTYLRTVRRMSQSELAKYVGVSRNTISNIEKGAEPSVGLALRIADVLNCSVKFLFEYNMGDWENEHDSFPTHYRKAKEKLYYNE